MYDAEVDASTYYNTSAGSVEMQSASEGPTLPRPFRTTPQVAGDAHSYSVVVDTGVVGTRAAAVASFLEEGRYLEGFDALHVGFHTWSPSTEHLTTAAVHVQRHPAGSIHVATSVRALPMRLVEPSVWAPVLQCVLVVAICVYDGRRVRNAYRDKRPLRDFHVLALVSTSLQIAATGVQLVLFVEKQRTRLQLQYDVYESLYSKANFFQLKKEAEGDVEAAAHPGERWRLPDDVRGMRSFLADHHHVDWLTQTTTVYWLLQSLSLALLLFRLESKMRFHRALGITSATMVKAAAPLAHFFVVFILVQGAAAVLGVIWFGLEHENFSSLGRALVSVFQLGVLGDFGEIHELISGSFFYKVREAGPEHRGGCCLPRALRLAARGVEYINAVEYVNINTNGRD